MSSNAGHDRAPESVEVRTLKLYVAEEKKARGVSPALIVGMLFAALWVGVIADLGMEVSASCMPHTALAQEEERHGAVLIPDFKAGRHSMCRAFKH